MRSRVKECVVLGILLCTTSSAAASGQAQPAPPPDAPRTLPSVPTTATPAPRPAKPGAPAAPAEAKVVPPADYVIGAEDVLEVVFWREKDLSGEVTVRPDGKVSLPLLNDVQAAGMTPEAFRQQLMEAAGRFVEEPNATVIVKAINSRKIYIIGSVGKPGPYPLGGPMTVMQLIGLAGGLTEFADEKNILVMRTADAKPQRLKFNYRDVTRGLRTEQNIDLKPGDTVIVP